MHLVTPTCGGSSVLLNKQALFPGSLTDVTDHQLLRDGTDFESLIKDTIYHLTGQAVSGNDLAHDMQFHTSVNI